LRVREGTKGDASGGECYGNLFIMGKQGDSCTRREIKRGNGGWWGGQVPFGLLSPGYRAIREHVTVFAVCFLLRGSVRRRVGEVI